MITIERGGLWKQVRSNVKKLDPSNIVIMLTSSTLRLMTKTSTSTSQGVPNEMVIRSHSINVHNLIQQIENHPQRQALQNDFQQHHAFNLFRKESKDAITASGNTELCEMFDVEPKSQCRACLTYWSAGIVYCTCGYFMKDDTTENKKYISSVLDLFSIPNFYIRKGQPHGHRYGKKLGCKEYHTANQLKEGVERRNLTRFTIDLSTTSSSEKQ